MGNLVTTIKSTNEETYAGSRCPECGYHVDYKALETLGFTCANKFHYPQHDPVNHPSHYTKHPSGIECIQVTEHMNFNLGNAVKYIWRCHDKNGIEDLEKAIWYIKREIERLNRD